MNDYFKPWRRKIGICILAIAGLFMPLWIRSLTTSNQVEFYPGELTFHIWSSNNGTLGWYSGEDNIPPKLRWRCHWRTKQTLQLNRVDNTYTTRQSRWIWQFLGVYRYTEVDCVDFNIRYSSIVVPLTLVSMSLLLLPTRKWHRTSKPTFLKPRRNSPMEIDLEKCSN